MSRLILIGRHLRSLAAAFGAARAVSAAVAAHRQPSAQSLEVLGIDPEQFRTIRLHKRIGCAPERHRPFVRARMY